MNSVTPRPKRPQTLAVRVAWYASLGVAMSIGLAVLGTIKPGRWETASHIVESHREATEGIHLGSVLDSWGATKIGWIGEEIGLDRLGTPEIEARVGNRVVPMPRWSTDLARREAEVFQNVGLGSVSRRERGEIAAGWPFRAFYGRWEVSRTGLRVGTVVNVKYGFLGPGQGSQRLVIPYKPIWAGLIGDVSVLGAGAAASVWFVRWNIRSVRRFRGRCESCGYELGALESCPECGEQR